MDVYSKLRKNGIQLSPENIKIIIDKYNIKELAIFGSSLRDDYTINSDIDLLIEFKESENISLFDLIEIQDYFEKLTNRPVDVVEPASITNPYRRSSILNSKEVLYVA